MIAKIFQIWREKQMIEYPLIKEKVMRDTKN